MKAALAVVLAVVCGMAAADDRAWIERSDRNSRMVLEVIGPFNSEWIS